MHDEHRSKCVGDHGRGDTANQMAHQSAAAVSADHNQTCLAFRGGLDDPLPVGAASTATFCARNPALSASDAPVGGCLLCTSGAWSASK